MTRSAANWLQHMARAFAYYIDIVASCCITLSVRECSSISDLTGSWGLSYIYSHLCFKSFPSVSLQLKKSTWGNLPDLQTHISVVKERNHLCHSWVVGSEGFIWTCLQELVCQSQQWMASHVSGQAWDLILPTTCSTFPEMRMRSLGVRHLHTTIIKVKSMVHPLVSVTVRGPGGAYHPWVSSRHPLGAHANPLASSD